MRLVWLVLAAGCYAPTYAPGGTCTTSCPGDLECVEGICVLPGSGGPGDAAVIDGADASTHATIDAPDIDAPPPDPTLIAHWTFDDNPSDGTISDSTGNGHNGTCVPPACPSLVAGIKGDGYRFDPALSQFVIVPDSNAFHASTFTVAAWMYTDNTTKQISVMAKTFGSGTNNSWQLENLTDDRVSFTTANSNGGNSLTSPNPVPQMTWTQLTGTYDGTTKKLYINGVMVASGTTTISYDGGAIYLGADNNNNSLALPFDGVLDDLRYYNRVLSAQEIQTLAQP